MTPEEIRLKFSTRHPATIQVLQYFADAHLGANLQKITSEIQSLAFDMLGMIKDGPELTVGLRKLLEAKDAMVRAYLEN